MTFFLARPGAEKVKESLAAAAAGKSELLMSVVNWGEIYYAVWRDRGPGDAQKTLAYIAQFPIELVPADLMQARIAAEFKARFKLPYADGFAAALASLRKAALLTSDADFSRVRGEISLTLL